MVNALVVDGMNHNEINATIARDAIAIMLTTMTYVMTKYYNA